MPIVRVYQCAECNHRLEVTLSAEQWDDPPPDCPNCAMVTQQEFRPVAIRGHQARIRDAANKFTEDVIGNDYKVGDINRDHHRGSTPKTRYKDANPQTDSSWGIANEALQAAVSAGRETRMKYGSGLYILQQNLKSGAEPDLIAASKRRSPRIW